MKFVLYGVCDSNTDSKKCVMQNYDPAHSTNNMTAREWTTGEYVHTKCNPVTQNLPQTSLDIYVAGWPCAAFSHRGERTLGDHPNADGICCVMKSIKLMNPAVFLLETVSSGEGTVSNEMWKSISENFVNT